MNAWAKIVRQNAERPWGLGWKRLSEDMRAALLAEAALGLLMAQELPKYKPAQDLIVNALDGRLPYGGAK